MMSASGSRELADLMQEKLGAITRPSDRIAEAVRLVRAATAFSTSLGLDDQALLQGIAESGAQIDVFTLDTGRLFPETWETIAVSERHFGLRIRVLAPDADEVEGLVGRDGIFGFRLSVEARKACCEVRKV